MGILLPGCGSCMSSLCTSLFSEKQKVRRVLCCEAFQYPLWQQIILFGSLSTVHLRREESDSGINMFSWYTLKGVHSPVCKKLAQCGFIRPTDNLYLWSVGQHKRVMPGLKTGHRTHLRFWTPYCISCCWMASNTVGWCLAIYMAIKSPYMVDMLVIFSL